MMTLFCIFILFRGKYGYNYLDNGFLVNLEWNVSRLLVQTPTELCYMRLPSVTSPHYH